MAAGYIWRTRLCKTSTHYTWSFIRTMWMKKRAQNDNDYFLLQMWCTYTVFLLHFPYRLYVWNSTLAASQDCILPFFVLLSWRLTMEGGRRWCSLRLILDCGFHLVCVTGERVGSQVVAARLYHPLGLVPNGCLCVANDCLVIHDEVLRWHRQIEPLSTKVKH